MAVSGNAAPAPGRLLLLLLLLGLTAPNAALAGYVETAAVKTRHFPERFVTAGDNTKIEEGTFTPRK